MTKSNTIAYTQYNVLHVNISSVYISVFYVHCSFIHKDVLFLYEIFVALFATLSNNVIHTKIIGQFLH